jgi:O-methyltransferase
MHRDDFVKDHRPTRSIDFHGYPIISDQISREGLEVVWNALESVLKNNVPGNIVEFGCYVGTTSLFIRRLLDRHQQSAHRSFHVYDSFEGLPDKSSADNNAAGVDFQAGKLYVSKKEFLHQFQAANLQAPVLHKGWFQNLTPADVPAQIAFAFLDGDFYQSILDSLRLVWPRMEQGGKILIDDYQRETLPGVAKAIKEFFQDKPQVRVQMQANIARIDL